VDRYILGRDRDVFWRYEENKRREFAWILEDVFRRERVKILSGFLDRQHSYHHREYREGFEAKARSNLEQTIARLSEQ
jgi:predicted metal-dependent HD superfamily phosphohydrolase